MLRSHIPPLRIIARRWPVPPAPKPPVEAYEPHPDDYRNEIYCSSVMRGSVWFNAVKPKLKCAGWRAIDTESAIDATCAFCGSTCLAGSDWIGPNHQPDGDDFRSFVHCMFCDRTVEYLYIRNCEPLPTDRVIYVGCPLTNADAEMLGHD